MSFINSTVSLFNKQISDRLKKYLQKQFAEYGKIEDLLIDFKKKTIWASVQLNGDKEKIRLIIDGIYSLKDINGYYLAFNNVKISRQWLQRLADNYLTTVLPDKKIKNSEIFGMIISKIF